MLAPSPRSNDVEYRILEPYGLTVFDCPALRATLQPANCAMNFRAMRDGSACRGCQLGAIHAGQPKAPSPPPKPACCRCGRTEQRLISGAVCVSCANRSWEVLKGKNSKGKLPTATGAKLRESFAIVRVINSGDALEKCFAKICSGTSEMYRRGIEQHHRPGTPLLSALDKRHVWISAVVTGAEELQRIVRRLLPGAVIADSEFSASFAERWRAENSAD